MSPKVQPFDPSQLIDQVIRPFRAPWYVFQACATEDGARYPPPAPDCAGRPGDLPVVRDVDGGALHDQAGVEAEAVGLCDEPLPFGE